MKILLMSCFIAGIPHRNPDLTKIKPQMPLSIRPESTNQYDPHAIAVFNGDEMLGYIPREQTIVIHNADSQGLKLEAFVGECGGPKWKEIILHVFATLP